MRNILLLCIFLTGFSTTVFAKTTSLEDPAIQDRFKALTSQLRCLKCQNMTIYDSQAGLADDLRKQIREQMHEGKTDDQIVAYLVARYGDFVRYKPPMEAKTVLLWVGPFLFMLIGGVMLVRYIKIRRNEAGNTDVENISEEEHLLARKLLEEGGDK